MGYLAHATLTLPESAPLHIISTYLPPPPLWNRIHAAVTSHITSLLQSPEHLGHSFIIGGDYNAVPSPSHRSSGTLTSRDKVFARTLNNLGLKSCDALPTPIHTFSTPNTQISSRIDDWLIPTVPSHPQPLSCEPLSDLHCISSDHLPLRVTFDHVALFGHMPAPPPTPMIHAPAPRFVRPFNKTHLQTYSQHVHTTHGAQASDLARTIQSMASSHCADPVSRSQLAAVTAEFEQLLSCAHTIALTTLPVKPSHAQNHTYGAGQPTPPPSPHDHSNPPTTTCRPTTHTRAPPPPTSTTHRPTFLPRKAAKQYHKHLGYLRLATQTLKHALSFNGRPSIPTAPPVALAALGLPREAFQEPITSTNRKCHPLTVALQQKISATRDALRTITSDHAHRLNQRHAAHIRKLYATSPAQVHRTILGSATNNTGTRTTTINHLKHPLGRTVSDPSLLKQAATFHHTVLHSPKLPPVVPTPPWEIQTFPDNFRLTSAVTHISLTAPITDDVFDYAIKKLKPDKAPGPDNIPNEHIKHLPPSFHSLTRAYFRLCWAVGETPASWHHSTTLLFHKKGDTTDLANYRPIALQATMAKLYSSIVTSVLQNFAEQHAILSPAQEGFRKHKNCSRQLTHLINIIEDARVHNKNLFLLNVDFKAAYDSLDHSRLFYTMKNLGFPHHAIQVVKELYTGTTTSVSLGHSTSSPIPIKRGVIQGDSLSPFLFLVYLEPLLRWLHVNDRGYLPGSALRPPVPQKFNPHQLMHMPMTYNS